MSNPLFFDAIKHIAHFKITNSQIDQLINEQKLPFLIDQIIEAIGWIEQIQPYPPFQTLTKKSLVNLKKIQNQIDNRYISYFESKSYFGDQEAYESPTILIGLGANRPTLDKRAQFLSTMAQQFASIPIIVSGGGFQIKQTEASFFKEILLENGINPTRIYLENDAMDTIGNALFSKFTLMKNKLLQPYSRMLILTSQFHCPRTLFLFQHIFSKDHKIACVGTQTTNEEQRSLFAEHEISSTEKAEQTIFRLPLFLIQTNNTFLNKNQHLEPQDSTSTFMNLITQHPFYKNRYDLIRKFASLLNLPTES